MVKVAMLHGRETVDLNLPDRTQVLEAAEVFPLPDPQAAVRKALAEPIGSPPLSRLAQGKATACVVVSDFTRPMPNQIILPSLLAALEEGGIARDKITLLIATGMHRPNLGQELVDLVGQEIVDGYHIVNHYCRQPETVRRVGQIDGAPIEINTDYLDADLKVLTGLIEPHMYAGYSGGRKSILPGISSFETMKFMHSFAMIDHPQVRNCVLEGNPFHEAGLKVTELVGADFILNAVVNKDHQLVGVFAGESKAAHLAGCEVVRKNSVIELDKRVDLVITSGGGYPLDATFYQVSKGLTIARDMLKPGGTVVALAECGEGLGGREFCQVMRQGHSVQTFRESYSDPDNFIIDQWCAQTIFQALTQAGRVYLYSERLAPDDITKMGLIRLDDPQALIDELVASHESIIAVPEGPYVVGLVA